jgi:hypothetical protein
MHTVYGVGDGAQGRECLVQAADRRRLAGEARAVVLGAAADVQRIDEELADVVETVEQHAKPHGRQPRLADQSWDRGRRDRYPRVTGPDRRMDAVQDQDSALHRPLARRLQPLPPRIAPHVHDELLRNRVHGRLVRALERPSHVRGCWR